MPATDVLAGITAALDAGAASHELVAIEARKAAHAAKVAPGEAPAGPTAGDGPAAVITLPGRPATLPPTAGPYRRWPPTTSSSPSGPGKPRHDHRNSQRRAKPPAPEADAADAAIEAAARTLHPPSVLDGYEKAVQDAQRERRTYQARKLRCPEPSGQSVH